MSLNDLTSNIHLNSSFARYLEANGDFVNLARLRYCTEVKRFRAALAAVSSGVPDDAFQRTFEAGASRLRDQFFRESPDSVLRDLTGEQLFEVQRTAGAPQLQRDAQQNVFARLADDIFPRLAEPFDTYVRSLVLNSVASEPAKPPRLPPHAAPTPTPQPSAPPAYSATLPAPATQPPPPPPYPGATQVQQASHPPPPPPAYHQVYPPQHQPYPATQQQVYPPAQHGYPPQYYPPPPAPAHYSPPAPSYQQQGPNSYEMRAVAPANGIVAVPPPTMSMDRNAPPQREQQNKQKKDKPKRKDQHGGSSSSSSSSASSDLDVDIGLDKKDKKDKKDRRRGDGGNAILVDTGTVDPVLVPVIISANTGVSPFGPGSSGPPVITAQDVSSGCCHGSSGSDSNNCCGDAGCWPCSCDGCCGGCNCCDGGGGGDCGGGGCDCNC